MTSEERYREMVKAFARRPCVSEDGRGFGSDALKVCGQIFAMGSSSGGSWSSSQSAGATSSRPGGCERFEPLPGQVMKEWLALRARSSLDWFLLAEEAPDFVLSA